MVKIAENSKIKQTFLEFFKYVGQRRGLVTLRVRLIWGIYSIKYHQHLIRTAGIFIQQEPLKLHIQIIRNLKSITKVLSRHHKLIPTPSL